MSFDAIPTGKNPPEEVNVIIEIQRNTGVKYEVEKETGALKADRALDMSYPQHYGYVPHTLCPDGDPADVILFMQEELLPTSYISARPIGVLLTEDEAGGDPKFLMVPVTKFSRRYEKYNSYKDIDPKDLEAIEYFFTHYKDREPNKWIKVTGWKDAADAKKLLQESIDAVSSDASTNVA